MSKEISYTITQDNISQMMNDVWLMVQKGLKAGSVVIKLGRPTRTLSQNRRMWAVLNDVSSQVVWHGARRDSESWKHIFSAALQRQEVVPGIDGGFVVLAVPTSSQSREWFSDLFELINAFGAERQVKWSDPALEAFDHYREAQ